MWLVTALLLYILSLQKKNSDLERNDPGKSFKNFLVYILWSSPLNALLNEYIRLSVIQKIFNKCYVLGRDRLVAAVSVI